MSQAPKFEGTELICLRIGNGGSKQGRGNFPSINDRSPRQIFSIDRLEASKTSGKIQPRLTSQCRHSQIEKHIRKFSMDPTSSTPTSVADTAFSLWIPFPRLLRLACRKRELKTWGVKQIRGAQGKKAFSGFCRCKSVPLENGANGNIKGAEETGKGWFSRREGSHHPFVASPFAAGQPSKQNCSIPPATPYPPLKRLDSLSLLTSCQGGSERGQLLQAGSGSGHQEGLQTPQITSTLGRPIAGLSFEQSEDRAGIDRQRHRL